MVGLPNWFFTNSYSSPTLPSLNYSCKLQVSFLSSTNGSSTIRHKYIFTIEELIAIPFLIEPTLFCRHNISTWLAQLKPFFTCNLNSGESPIIYSHYKATYVLQLNFTVLFLLLRAFCLLFINFIFSLLTFVFIQLTWFIFELISQFKYYLE